MEEGDGFAAVSAKFRRPIRCPSHGVIRRYLEQTKSAKFAISAFPTPNLPLYSCLSASIGGTPAARRAGIQLAASPTITNRIAPPTMLDGSSACNP